MQNMLTLETNKYAIKIENFEGPLDLLCHLIDKNKMNINDIRLSEITDQYIEYINKMEEMNLEVTSEFLIMASTLIYLKSKSLLPKQNEEEEEISEEELLRRIIEYKKYKEIKKTLIAMYEKNAKEILKELVNRPKFIFNALFSLNKCEKEEVVTAFSGLLELSRRNKVITNQDRIFGDISVEKQNDK